MKKNYQIYKTLLEFVKSFDLYKKTKTLKDLSEKDIREFAKIYYLE